MKSIFSKLGAIFTSKKSEDRISVLFTLYFMFGIIFASSFAYYYRWEFYGYFSPNFFVVVFSWPYQAIGFVKDLLYYGLAGKPI